MPGKALGSLGLVCVGFPWLLYAQASTCLVGSQQHRLTAQFPRSDVPTGLTGRPQGPSAAASSGGSGGTHFPAFSSF